MQQFESVSNVFSNGQFGTDDDKNDGAIAASVDVQQSLRQLITQLPASQEVQQLQAWIEHVDWLQYFQRCSRLLIAVIDPNTLSLQYANDYFCQLAGVRVDSLQSDPDHPLDGRLSTALPQLLSDADNLTIQRLYKRHLMHLVFRDIYGCDLAGGRLLDQSVMLVLQSPLYPEPRYVELWLRSEQLRIVRLHSEVHEFADLQLEQMSSEELQAQLTDPIRLRELEGRLRLDQYRVEGRLLLEGLDVTARETIRQITQLLIDRDSILQPQKFRQVNQQLRSLFQMQNTVVLSVESDQIGVFMGSMGQRVDATTYSMDSLQGSHFIEAMQSNRVMTIPDLAIDCRTECGRHLLDLGARSLLLIPLVAQVKGEARGDTEDSRDVNYPLSYTSQAVGLVGLLSDRPHNFDALDYSYAEQLIPAFTVALTSAQRQLFQQRFITNIHPSVEWRFLQEAERRSLGLPAEPIVFTDVYPLYGISDIRGSSDERNRAIQQDLLEQFKLGLAIVEAACAARESALANQMRLDLLDHIHQLEEKVTVDAEVSGIRYLHQHLEEHFDYFLQCGEAAIAAIELYRNACSNENQCIYHARAHYDQTIGRINALLRKTWDHWQQKMQKVSPHYCDIEATDGIDHMIYAGKSIDPNFSRFHLRSLRYEQLRAMCDCARTAFHLEQECNSDMQVTHLVLVQDLTVDIFHDESTEKLFDVRGTRDTRYEIVKKRIDKAIDATMQTRITQPGMLTLVYSTEEEWDEYQQYFQYLNREGWIDRPIERGMVQPLQGVNGLKYVRVRVLPTETDT
jgi:hypothetical protein